MRINGLAMRAIREGKGVSVRGLAHDMACSPSLISRLERGERGKRYITDPTLLPRIAERLGVTVAALTMQDAA